MSIFARVINRLLNLVLYALAVDLSEKCNSLQMHIEVTIVQKTIIITELDSNYNNL